MIEAIYAVCDYCYEERTFAGDDAEEDWRTSGWLIRLNEDNGEQEYCSLDCAISDA